MQPSRLSPRSLPAVSCFDLATCPTGSRGRRMNHILNMQEGRTGENMIRNQLLEGRAAARQN